MNTVLISCDRRGDITKSLCFANVKNSWSGPPQSAAASPRNLSFMSCSFTFNICLNKTDQNLSGSRWMIVLFSFLGTQSNLSLIFPINASRSLKESWFDGAWLLLSSLSCRHSSKNLATSTSPNTTLLHSRGQCTAFCNGFYQCAYWSFIISWIIKFVRTMSQSITNAFSIFATGVSLSIRLNEFKLMARLDDPIECLKHNGGSLTRENSTGDIKVSFIDAVDML